MLVWDRSHEYVLHRFFIDRSRLTIQFKQSPPSLRELVAIRKVLPQFRHTAPAAVKQQLGTSHVLDLGEMPTREARQLANAARNADLNALIESASSVGYLPFDITTGCAWLIEDEAESDLIVQEMINAGVPVQDVEA